MWTWKTLAAAGWFLCLAFTPALADRYSLQEKPAVGDEWQIDLDLKVAGQLFVRSGDKTVTLDLTATAQHRFPERVLDVDPAGRPARIARLYDQARAAITVHGATTQRSLRPERRFQVAQILKDQTVTFCPNGPLTREEHELTGEHFDILAVFGLFPSQEVEVGESWEISNAAAQALAGLDGLINQDLKGKLDKVDGDYALFRCQGTIVGITAGSETTIQAECAGWFHLKNRRWVSLTWRQREERSHGPVHPASKTESMTTLKRTFPGANSALATAANGIPTDVEPARLLLACRDPKGRWEFVHDRAWHVVAQSEQYSVLRLLERGELIGQVNVLSLPKLKPGQHMTPDEVRKQVTEAPGQMVEQVLQVGEVPGEQGFWIYRVSLVGKSSDVALLQNHYVVAGPQGDHALLSFTTDVAQAERLNGRDLSIVGAVTFPK